VAASNVATFEAATWAKSMYMKKIMIENQKRGENMEIKEIFT